MADKVGLIPDNQTLMILGKGVNTKNLLLINVIYHRPMKENDWNDFCSLILKDTKTGEKKVVTIEDPKMAMYIVKSEYRNYSYTPAYMKLDKCIPKMIKYKDVLDEIVEVAGDAGKDFKRNCLANNIAALKNLHKYPYVLGTDINYADYFRCEWALHYHNQNVNMNISKTFMDIEVDSIDIQGFPSSGSCPINAVSLVDAVGKTVYVFLLRNDKNKQIAEFEDNIDNFKKECHKAFDESYGELDYRFFMYNENKEIILIQQLFALIHKLKRDFLLIWNMAFDIPFIIERIKVLGYDPRDIMCDPDFKVKDLYYRKDNFHYDFKTRNDSFTISSYTVFLDQMMQYIKIRKGRGELKSVKLNAIAKAELNDSKLDYSDEADIKTLPYVNYRKFVLYNIKDTLLLYGIENKTHDTDNIFARALVNGTSYQSLFSQTILLKNRTYISYMEQGYILGNNRNIDYSIKRDPAKEREEEKNREKYAGALVGDPKLNDYVGKEIFGRQSRWIFEHVVDMDASSMYPNIYIAHNIGQETMIGKLVLDGFENLEHPQDPSESKIYDGGKMFIEALLTKDYSFIGENYFNLPKVEDIIAEIESEE